MAAGLRACGPNCNDSKVGRGRDYFWGGWPGAFRLLELTRTVRATKHGNDQMNRKIVLAVLSATGMALSCSPAFAWSCVAGSSDGAQGWSNNYNTVAAAERRALRECENVTTSYDCEVLQCFPDNGKS